MMINPQTRDTEKTIIRAGREVKDRAYHYVQQQINGWMMKYDKSLLSKDIRKDSRFPNVDFGSLKIVRQKSSIIWLCPDSLNKSSGSDKALYFCYL
jgi:hypothetical protein